MKPNLLYIRRDPRDYESLEVRWETQERDFTVAVALDRFKVYFHTNLLTLNPDMAGKYNFIITHLQDDPLVSAFTYNSSINQIRKIYEQNPNTKIVVYTGASERAASDEQLKEAGATAVIRKKSFRHLQEDVATVKKCLEELLP